MHLLTRESEERLISRLDRGFGQFSQSLTAAFQVGQKAVIASRTRISELVDRAAPYVEAIASFTPLATKDTPNFLFCSDTDAARQLVASINEKLKDDRYAPAGSPLDHFVIFYHEAVGLALSDLAITRDANALLMEMEKDPNRIATNFTHKEGEKMFNFKSIQHVVLASQWINSLKYLAPDTFQLVGTDLCLEYKTPEGLTKLFPVENPQAVRDYVERQGVDGLIKRFVAQLNALGKQGVLERMETRWKQAPSVSEKEALTESHQAILRKVFG